MREVAYQIDAREIYVVPDFISEGYFTQDVIPRELELTGPTTEVNGKIFYYCLPVGVHRSMTDLILRRAREVAPKANPAETTLIITGHGTGLNQNSTKAIRDQVEHIARSGAGFAKVADAFMEEPPLIAEWDQIAPTPNVIVVPFFIADGLHSYQDIPVLLGIENEPGAAASQREVFRNNPHRLRGKTLYYSSAIGTERLIADVILDQIEDFDRTHRPAPVTETAPAIARQLREWLRSGVRRIGEIEIQSDVYGYTYVLSHFADAEKATDAALGGLDLHEGPQAARDLSTYSEDGEYRFSKAQTNLRRGWVMALADEEELRLALDQFYPSAVGLLLAQRSGELQIEHLRDKLRRQTGMYRFAHTISDAGAQELVRQVCGPAHQCAKKILWQLDANTPLDDSPASRYEGIVGDAPAAQAIPLLCREACNHFVAECRKAARAENTARQPAH